MDSVGEGIHSIGVVEGLGTKGLEKNGTSSERITVVHVGIGLNNPDELLTWVVEVKLDLVGRRSNRLISGELELLNQVFMRVLGELSALISIKEDIVDVKGGSNKGLLVSLGNSDGTGGGGSQSSDGPEALTNRTEIDVDLDFVVLYEPLNTPPFGVFIGIFVTDQQLHITKTWPGARLYLKLSSYVISTLKPISI
jgi:hypothetical protein